MLQTNGLYICRIKNGTGDLKIQQMLVLNKCVPLSEFANRFEGLSKNCVHLCAC